MPASTAAMPSVERPQQRSTILLRQLCYFGIPMTLLSVGAILTWSGPGANYVAHMYQAQLLSQQGPGRSGAGGSTRRLRTDESHCHLHADRASCKRRRSRQAALAF